MSSSCAPFSGRPSVSFDGTAGAETLMSSFEGAAIVVSGTISGKSSSTVGASSMLSDAAPTSVGTISSGGLVTSSAGTTPSSAWFITSDGSAPSDPISRSSPVSGSKPGASSRSCATSSIGLAGGLTRISSGLFMESSMRPMVLWPISWTGTLRPSCSRALTLSSHSSESELKSHPQKSHW